MAARFLPTQWLSGCGNKEGLEAAVHTLRGFIESHGDNTDQCCIKIDFSNAFKMSINILPYFAKSKGTFLKYLHGISGVNIAPENCTLPISPLSQQLVYNKKTLSILCIVPSLF